MDKLDRLVLTGITALAIGFIGAITYYGIGSAKLSKIDAVKEDREIMKEYVYTLSRRADPLYLDDFLDSSTISRYERDINMYIERADSLCKEHERLKSTDEWKMASAERNKYNIISLSSLMSGVVIFMYSMSRYTCTRRKEEKAKMNELTSEDLK